MPQPRLGAREWALLGALSALWGGSFFFVAVALEGFGPLSVVLGRVGIGAGALLAFVYATGRSLPSDPAAWRAFAVMGALNNAAPFSLIAWGQVHIASGTAAILNATTPLFALVLAHAMTADERMTWNRALGVGAGFVGVAVLMGPDAARGLGARSLGEAAVLAAAVSYALAGIYGRRLGALDPTVAAAGMLVASAVTMAPLALAVEGLPATGPGMTAWASLAGLGVLSTALAYPLYFRILQTAGATNLLLVTFLIPVSALALGIAFLGERPQWTAYAGMALIFLGLAAVDGRPLRWVLRPRPPRPSPR